MKQVQVITSKTTSMLGLIHRTASNTYNIHAKGLVPVHSAQQVRIFQPGVGTYAVTDILSIERVQRQATKFILPFLSEQPQHTGNDDGLLVFSQSAIGTIIYN